MYMHFCAPLRYSSVNICWNKSVSNKICRENWNIVFSTVSSWGFTVFRFIKEKGLCQNSYAMLKFHNIWLVQEPWGKKTAIPIWTIFVGESVQELMRCYKIRLFCVIQFPGGTRDFSLLQSMQIVCVAHPANCPVSTRSKAARALPWPLTPLSSAEVNVWSYSSTTPNTFMASCLIKHIQLYVYGW